MIRGAISNYQDNFPNTYTLYRTKVSWMSCFMLLLTFQRLFRNIKIIKGICICERKCLLKRDKTPHFDNQYQRCYGMTQLFIHIFTALFSSCQQPSTFINFEACQHIRLKLTYIGSQDRQNSYARQPVWAVKCPHRYRTWLKSRDMA